MDDELGGASELIRLLQISMSRFGILKKHPREAASFSSDDGEGFTIL